LVDPAIADLQAEYEKASRRGARGDGRLVSSLRACLGLAGPN
jgi:hypothetical protein